MNEIIKTLENHRSIRRYTAEAVSEEQIQIIIDAAQAAPSSIGGQQVTIIAIQDKERKKRISELAGGQPYIDQAPVFLLFCADFNRASIACEINGTSMNVQNCTESVLVGSVDVGISLGFAIAAAESMKLGIVAIGAVRGQMNEIAELAELPEYVFPLVGLVVGHPSDWSKLKPRLSKAAVFHREKYDNSNMRRLIEGYDKKYYGYVDQRGGDPHTWSSRVASVYNKTYYLNVRPLIEKQGFELQ